MRADREEAAHEIVIVRSRGGDHEEGHHGGAWKIAYADFMTAMMAFFLVMWLINSTDDKTISQVATYFNPMKLNDKAPSHKGLQAAGAASLAVAAPSGGINVAKEKKKKKKASKTAGDDGDHVPAARRTDAGAIVPERNTRSLDVDPLNDPYDLLQRLSAEFKTQHPDARLEPAPAAEGRSGRQDALVIAHQKDPFDMDFRRPAAGATPMTATVNPVAGGTAGADLAGEIERRLVGMKLDHRPAIEVGTENGEILVSLTDRFDFGMFDIGSARPNPTLVVVMEMIGKSLAERSGRISIRGHTDGRPYRSQRFDNWRLSTARAVMAHHMLVRGGLAEGRFERIEGWADRRLKAPDDPGAAVNRRIEILLKSDG